MGEGGEPEALRGAALAVRYRSSSAIERAGPPRRGPRPTLRSSAARAPPPPPSQDPTTSRAEKLFHKNKDLDKNDENFYWFSRKPKIFDRSQQNENNAQTKILKNPRDKRSDLKNNKDFRFRDKRSDFKSNEDFCFLCRQSFVSGLGGVQKVRPKDIHKCIEDKNRRRKIEIVVKLENREGYDNKYKSLDVCGGCRYIHQPKQVTPEYNRLRREKPSIKLYFNRFTKTQRESRHRKKNRRQHSNFAGRHTRVPHREAREMRAPRKPSAWQRKSSDPRNLSPDPPPLPPPSASGEEKETPQR